MGLICFDSANQHRVVVLCDFLVAMKNRLIEQLQKNWMKGRAVSIMFEGCYQLWFKNKHVDTGEQYNYFMK